MAKYNLLFGLQLCERILKITDNLSKTASMSTSEAQAIAKMTVKTLQKMRTDDMFKLFFLHVDNLCERTNTEEPFLPRKRRTPVHFEVGEGDCHYSPTVEDHYRRHYFEALD